jgi:hypothetical protein
LYLKASVTQIQLFAWDLDWPATGVEARNIGRKYNTDERHLLEGCGMGGILYLLVLILHSFQNAAYDIIEVATRFA